MDRIFVVIMVFSLLFIACNKEKPAQAPAPIVPEVKTGDLHIKVTTYNPLGEEQADHSGVKVVLQTGAAATTGVTGEVSFTGLAYGIYAPSLIKQGFDGPPAIHELSSSSFTFDLPFPEHSNYVLSNQQYLIIQKDSIIMNFKLDKAVPQGKFCKIAVLTSTSSGLSASGYGTADMIAVSAQNVSQFNIARLPNLKAAVNSFSTGTLFYVAAVPVSYGLYESNVAAKPYLLGESLQYPGNIQLIKNW